MDKDNSSSKLPTVNYINITRRPEGGIVNVEMKRQPGPSNSGESLRSMTSRGSSLPSSFTDLTDPIALFDNSARLKSLLRQHQQKFGPSGFSITSSDSPVSKDSEGTRLVINPPPLPAHSERHGPYHVVIHHPRSQSTESVVVNAVPGGSGTRASPAPRSNSTSNVSVLETKFPSLRAVSPFGQRSFLISSPLFSEGGTRLSLFDRFNEHAPPSFFDSKLRSASNPENLHVSKVTVMRDGNQKVHNIPIKIEGRDSKQAKSSSKPSVVYKIPINLVSKNSEDKSSQQPPLPVQVSVRPRGISIPIITHRATPSDAEQKLAALTKQLEDEMRSASRILPTKPATPPQPVKPVLPTPVVNESVPEVVYVASPVTEVRSLPAQEEFKLSQVLENISSDVEPQKKKPDLLEKSTEALEKKQEVVEEGRKDVVEEREDSKDEQNFGICSKCNKDVMADACKAMGKLYHSTCFQCCLCSKLLKGKSFFDIQGTVYCDDDFMKAGYRRVAGNCHSCGSCVSDMVLQALGRTYHPSCFLCCQCSKNLENEAFAVDANDRIFCIEDYYQLHSCKCHACEQIILPPNGENELVRVLVKEKYYHLECLKCKNCGLSLGSDERCFISRGDITCRRCHGQS